MRGRNRGRAAMLAAIGTVGCTLAALAQPAAAQVYPAAQPIRKDGTTLHLQDYATVPQTTSGTSSNQTSNQVARVNFLRSEPAGAPGAGSRFFTNDLNGSMYVLDRATRSFDSNPLTPALEPYLRFQDHFSRFDTSPGFAAGVVTFQFDPEYANAGSPHFGKFYTTHTEVSGSGTNFREAVLTGWQDSNPIDRTFSGTQREMMRVTYQNNLHPIGDLVFNPNAGPGHADYRNLYISSGDGGAGETTSGRNVPQNLDNLLGKILRIHPDAAGDAPYGIPAANAWASDGDASTRGEVYARGLRNPHRLHWDGPTDKLIVNDIGLRHWEEVNVVNPGANYGYSQREGNMALTISSNTTNSVAGRPGNDSTFGYSYPAVAYDHVEGDAISSGFVYRGSRAPHLQGKYVFADITTGRLFYCDYAELLAKDADGDPDTQAAVAEIQVVFEGENRRMFDLVKDEYDLRNDGLDDNDQLPGTAAVTAGLDPYGVAYGGGRADIRLAMDGDGELYILSKSDGMIRAIVPEPGSGLALVVLALALARRRTRRVA